MNCPDGTCSAWVLKHYLEKMNNTEDVEFFGCIAGKTLNIDHKNKDVYFVDISYKRDQILQIAKVAKSITIYDHHESARKELIDLKEDNIHTVFDMARCGAQITWDEKFPKMKRPWFVEIIADRDLWKFEIPESKEIGKYLMYYNMYNNESYDALLNCNKNDIDNMKKEGKLLLEVETKQNNRIAKGANITLLTTPDKQQYKVYLVNCLHENSSDVGNILAQKQDCDFAACFRYNYPTDEWWISLRAHHDHIDLTNIAKQYGGGGHKKASGISIKGNLHDFFKLTT